MTRRHCLSLLFLLLGGWLGCSRRIPRVNAPEDLQGREGQRVLVNSYVTRTYRGFDAERSKDIGYERHALQRYYLLANDIVVQVPEPFLLRYGSRVHMKATVHCNGESCYLELRGYGWGTYEQ